MSGFGEFLNHRQRRGRENDTHEKEILLQGDIESDSSLDLPGPRRDRQRKPSLSRRILLKVVTRLFVLLIASFTIRFALQPLTRGQTSASSLAAGLEQCRYIATIPGPSGDFHQRAHSDRFEFGTRAVLLKNAKIWTGNSEGNEVIEGDVLLDGGILKAVGEVDAKYLGSLRLKGEVDEVDVGGKWVTPGIVDGHSHGQSCRTNLRHPY